MVSEMMIAMQVKRWISEHVKARWMLHALNCRRDGCYMRATQAMDHEDETQDASTMDRGSSDGSMYNKRLNGGWISEQLKDRSMDQGAIERTMESASGGWIREL